MALWEETESASSLPLCLCKRHGHVRTAGRWPSADQKQGSHWICWYLDLRLPASRIVRNECLLVKPSSVQFSSVAQSCLTLCDPMNCLTLWHFLRLPELTKMWNQMLMQDLVDKVVRGSEAVDQLPLTTNSGLTSTWCRPMASCPSHGWAALWAVTLLSRCWMFSLSSKLLSCSRNISSHHFPLTHSLHYLWVPSDQWSICPVPTCGSPQGPTPVAGISSHWGRGQLLVWHGEWMTKKTVSGS